METLKSWLKAILYVNVLLLVCETLIRDTKYEKYFKYFSGFLLMLCLLKPVLDLTDISTLLDASYLQDAIKNEMHIVEQEDEFQDVKEEMQMEYASMMETQVRSLADRYAIEVTGMEVEWDARGDSVSDLHITGRKAGDGEEEAQIDSFREALMKVYPLGKDNINIEMRE